MRAARARCWVVRVAAAVSLWVCHSCTYVLRVLLLSVGTNGDIFEISRWPPLVTRAYGSKSAGGPGSAEYIHSFELVSDGACGFSIFRASLCTCGRMPRQPTASGYDMPGAACIVHNAFPEHGRTPRRYGDSCVTGGSWVAAIFADADTDAAREGTSQMTDLDPDTVCTMNTTQHDTARLERHDQTSTAYIAHIRAPQRYKAQGAAAPRFARDRRHTNDAHSALGTGHWRESNGKGRL